MMTTLNKQYFTLFTRLMAASVFNAYRHDQPRSERKAKIDGVKAAILRDFKCLCESDNDCVSGREWCRAAGEDTSSPSVCVPFAQEGDSCSGFVLPGQEQVCPRALLSSSSSSSSDTT